MEQLDLSTNSGDSDVSADSVPSPSVVTPPRTSGARADPLVPIVMVDYDIDNKDDEPGAAGEARNIKLAFDRKDIKAWLTRLEIRLEFAGVRSQWLKRLCLENILPEDIAHACKDLFCLAKTEAGDEIYKQCKTRLLTVFGPKPEEDYLKAQSLVMTGLPSLAAKELRNLMCHQK